MGILYQNPAKTITVIDIPRSIELAQGHRSPGRLLSCTPLQEPYPSVEPKSAKARAQLPEVPLQELLLQRHLALALEEVERDFTDAKWCLERVISDEQHHSEQEEQEDASKYEILTLQNPTSELILHAINPSGLAVSLPPHSTTIQGEIKHTLHIFTISAPKFDIVVLDPPWPNRSARRKNSYFTSYGKREIHDLLLSLPLPTHLANNAIVAVWVTNKPAFRDMLLEEGGVFDAWGVQLVEEWVWVKVTASGVPICGLDSRWRKPYEILLLARKLPRPVFGGVAEVDRRVVISVPDIHSQKPSLKGLFEDVFGKEEGTYEGLEIFARNLTSGWWSWGNEVLKFQFLDCWAGSMNCRPSTPTAPI
ncbi:MT-A70-domain-containing protein [Calycina marina]|uniref:MT-A70-domain-containing protein n=1 Tax=Calycina marina TaxID=1763456 RepID=A0A9P7YXY8_9HELO|nr:MT-A70-domain-containing protein [Calycina marina]